MYILAMIYMLAWHLTGDTLRYIHIITRQYTAFVRLVPVNGGRAVAGDPSVANHSLWYVSTDYIVCCWHIMEIQTCMFDWCQVHGTD